MDSKSGTEEPSTHSAKRSNYAAEYRREYDSKQRDASQPVEGAEFLLKNARRLREYRSRGDATTSRPTKTEAVYKREYRARQRATSRPEERAEFLSKEARRLREYRARKKSTSSRSTKMEAEYKKEYRARRRATSQPEERAEFLSKEARRLRDYRARKKALPTSDAVTTVLQVQLVNDEATDESLSDEDNDPRFDVLWHEQEAIIDEQQPNSDEQREIERQRQHFSSHFCGTSRDAPVFLFQISQLPSIAGA